MQDDEPKPDEQTDGGSQADIDKSDGGAPGMDDTGADKPAADTGATRVMSERKGSKRWVKIVAALVVIAIIVAGGFLWWHGRNQPKSPVSASTTAAKSAAKAQGLQLDTNKNYGNKYKDGVLPVGDGKYTSSSAKQGYVYACSQYAQNLSTQNGGAMTRGPWFTDGGKEYRVNDKLHVEGSVMWKASFTDTVKGSTRTIVTNDLPNQPTGIFPIMTSDPAYAYDRNPNTIKGQTLTFALNADPSYGNPSCTGGEVGVMLNGVVLFNGLDAGGRDAGAWEVQDKCDGHPQSDGVYHYHTLSTCIKDVSVHNVIGFALDGFPITGPQVGPNDYLTTSDLDVCHGITSTVNLNGKQVTTYHYVMTEDFPYSISCFRGKAVQTQGVGKEASSGQPGQTSGPAGHNGKTGPGGSPPPPPGVPGARPQ